MPSKQLASWDGQKKRWSKNVDGKRYRVSCRQLGLPRPMWTKEKSRSAANKYFEEILFGIGAANELPAVASEAVDLIERKIQWAIENQKPVKTLEQQKQSIIDNPESPDLWEAGDLSESIEMARQLGIVVPDDIDPDVAAHYFGDRRIWQERLIKTTPPTEQEFRLESQLERFLEIEKAKGNAETTDDELRKKLTRIINAKLNDRFVLSPTMDCRKIDSKTVDQVYLWTKTEFETGRKHFAFFRRFARHMIERQIIDPISNLESRQFKFDNSTKAIPTYPKKTVVNCLNSLKPRFKLYALLALNTSMYGVDIANIAWNESDSICWLNEKKKTITRKRIKTRKRSNVPTITYPLWKTTFDLLMKHKSTHEKWVLTSMANTKLWTPSRNLITQQWGRVEPKIGINLNEFRSIGATKIRENKSYLHMIEAYLANAPSDITEKNYAPPSQRLINEMIRWLGRQFDQK